MMNTEKADKSDELSQPRQWWQWLLLYPVLATSVIAAVPTYVEAFNATKYNVPFGESENAKEDNKKPVVK